MDISHLKKLRRLPIVFVVAAIAVCALPQIASAQPTIINEHEEPLEDGAQITAVTHDFAITRATGLTMECKTVYLHTELADAGEDPIQLRQSEEGASPIFEECSSGHPGAHIPMEITPYEVPWKPIQLSSNGTGSFEMWVSLAWPGYEGSCVAGLWMKWVSFTSNTSYLDADGELDPLGQCLGGTPVSMHNIVLSHEGENVTLLQ